MMPLLPPVVVVRVVVVLVRLGVVLVVVVAVVVVLMLRLLPRVAAARAVRRAVSRLLSCSHALVARRRHSAAAVREGATPAHMVIQYPTMLAHPAWRRWSCHTHVAAQLWPCVCLRRRRSSSVPAPVHRTSPSHKLPAVGAPPIAHTTALGASVLYGGSVDG